MTQKEPTARTGSVNEKGALPWVLWIGACLFTNVDLGSGLYCSQLLLSCVVLAWVSRYLYRASRRLFLIPFSVIVLVSWSLVVHRQTDGNRFVPELIKIVLITVAPIVLRDLNFGRYLNQVTLTLPICTSVLVIATRLAGNWDYYDPIYHRFCVPFLGGSPNAPAYIFAFCMLMIHYQLKLGPGRVKRVCLMASFLVLAIAMMATQSRGGMVIYLAGLCAFLGKRWRVPLLICGAIVIAVMLFLPFSRELSRFNLIEDAETSGGSGRAFVWAQLIADLVAHPYTILVGNGPGSINFQLFGLHLIQSAHSMVLESIYSYGLLGLGALVWLMIRIRRSFRFYAPDLMQVRLYKAIWLGLLVGSVLDSYPLGAQTLWFTPALIALLMPRRGVLPECAGATRERVAPLLRPGIVTGVPKESCI